MAGMITARKRDKDLCRHCFQPLISHVNGGYEHHVPEGFPGGPRTPGVHSDVPY